MRCPMEANLDLQKLETYSFTELETECKLHSLKYRKSKPYFIQAIKTHYCSTAHGFVHPETFNQSVKEEAI